MLALMSILFFAIPILLNLINLKYLYDIKKESNCEEINSPYINIFFNYYLIELCLLILLIIIFSYIFHNYNKINNLKMTHTRLFLIKLSKTIGNLFKKNKKIFELFTLLISGILIKLYYDIGKEEQCKNIDKYTRLYLFYGQIIGFCIISYNIIVN
jgi:hypothetical protein